MRHHDIFKTDLRSKDLGPLGLTRLILCTPPTPATPPVYPVGMVRSEVPQLLKDIPWLGAHMWSATCLPPMFVSPLKSMPVPRAHSSLPRQPGSVSRGHQGSPTAGSLNLVRKGSAVVAGETLLPLLVNISSGRQWARLSLSWEECCVLVMVATGLLLTPLSSLCVAHLFKFVLSECDY